MLCRRRLLCGGSAHQLVQDRFAAGRPVPRRFSSSAAAVAPQVRAALRAAGATVDAPVHAALLPPTVWAASRDPALAPAAGSPPFFTWGNPRHAFPPAAAVCAGEHVALAPSSLQADAPAVLRALADVPDVGAPLSSVAVLHGRLPAWLLSFNDVFEVLDGPPAAVRPTETQNGSGAAPEGPWVVPVRHRDGNAFVRALRRVLHQRLPDSVTDSGTTEAGSPTGPELDVDDLIAALKRVLDQEAASVSPPRPALPCDPAAHGFSQLTDALMLVADNHFIKNNKIVPVLWAVPVAAAWRNAPHEGVLAHGFLRLLCAHVPSFRGGSLPGLTVPQWVAMHFGHLWHVSAARTDGTTAVFRPKRLFAGLPQASEPTYGFSGFARDVLAALRAGGGSAASGPAGSAGGRAVSASEYVDLSVLAPYLRPSAADYGATTWLHLLDAHRDVLDFDVRLVARELEGAPRVAVFIDATRVTAAEATAALQARLRLPPHAVLRRVVVRPAAGGVAHTGQDVVCGSFLDPWHVIAAHIAALPQDFLASAGLSKAVIICGDAEASHYEELALETHSVPIHVHVVT